MKGKMYNSCVSEVEGSNVIALTKKLISFNTVNPPGNEMETAIFIGDLLSKNGFETKYIPFGENRFHLIAGKGISSEIAPVVFSGHFDTVPTGTRKWKSDPFSASISDGKIYGRGSSDMKGAIAAMVIASIMAFEEGSPKRGLRLIFTSGEETGCQGIQHLAETVKDPGDAALIIVGEPTSNFPCIGHKGALYLNVEIQGKTAHSSMPELGDNAIYKAARAILKVEALNFNVEIDSLLGYPSKNVGRMTGGININSVPDHAEFSIDIRTTKKLKHNDFLQILRQELGNDVKIHKLVDIDAMASDQQNYFVKSVFKECELDPDDISLLRTLPYLTDGSVLQKLYHGAPTVILGPGQPEMAHQTDEFCYIEKLFKAVEIYRRILLTI
jgi:succinyl-diaminopimelate desuccinylase